VTTDTHPQADAVVIGGGVAGLWSAAVLAKRGYSVLLIEKAALGSGQTIASQGILHGGIKYTLSGTATAAAKAVAEMPARWQAAMTHAPSADLDLRAVKTLCPAQYLWTTSSFFSRMTAKVAAKAIRTHVRAVEPENACEGLRGAVGETAIGHRVDIHQVDEPVIDPLSLLAALRDEFVRAGGVIRIGHPFFKMMGDTRSVTIEGATVRFSTLVLAAGAGNGELASSLSSPARMQRRWLHMVMARGHLPEVFGHCVAAISDKPRITITTQRDSAGRNVWYIGGRIAEDGVQRYPDAQIAAAQEEVKACLPWVRMEGTQWATLRIDRAEGMTEGNARPDLPVVVESISTGAPVVTLWPTKLVFAPLAGDMVLNFVARSLGSPSTTDGLAPLRSESRPETPIAPLPWESPEVQWS
jgi:glycerol-3-phosphate dehydrogenase